MFPPEIFQEMVCSIADMLKRNNVRFALTGGLIASFYAEPRATQDADIIVEQSAMLASLDAIIEAFHSMQFLFDEEDVRRCVRKGRMFQIIDTVHHLKADFYPQELIEGELDRVVVGEIFPGVKLPIISRPDAVVSKLVWISMGSHKSRRETRHLMRRATEEEIKMVRRFAEQKSLTALLDEVLAEPDEIRP